MNDIANSIIGRTIVDVCVDENEEIVFFLDDGNEILIGQDEDGEICLIISDEEMDS